MSNEITHTSLGYLLFPCPVPKIDETAPFFCQRHCSLIREGACTERSYQLLDCTVRSESTRAVECASDMF